LSWLQSEFCILPRLTALQNVELPLIYSGMSFSERKMKAMEILERVGLSDKMHSLPNQLSGGQQQRIAIARAMVTNPSVLLADEPTGALDQKTGDQIVSLFEQLNRDGITIVMITHDRNIAVRARRIIHILDGVVSEQELKPFVS